MLPAKEKSLVGWNPQSAGERQGEVLVRNQLKVSSPSEFPVYSTVCSQRWQLCEVMDVVSCDDYSRSHGVCVIIWSILPQDKASREEVDVIV